MNGTFFYIGLGTGLALACGLRPFLPALLAGGLGSAGALGVAFTHEPFRFLQSGWWLLAVTLALTLSYVLQLRLGLSPTLDADAARSSANPLGLALTLIACVTGALLFAGTLAAHRDAWWPGLIAGAAAVVLAQRAVGPLLARVRGRLDDRAAREALTLYLDLGSLLIALVVALFHPLGYLALLGFGWLLLRSRARSDATYQGLRILRR